MRVPDPRHKDFLVTDELDESAEEPAFPEREPGGLTYGLTAEETRRGEPLASALAREEPDVDDDVADEDIEGWADDEEDAAAGRLVEHRVVREHFVDEIDDDGDYSAEEAALHVVTE